MDARFTACRGGGVAIQRSAGGAQRVGEARARVGPQRRALCDRDRPADFDARPVGLATRWSICFSAARRAISRRISSANRDRARLVRRSHMERREQSPSGKPSGAQANRPARSEFSSPCRARLGSGCVRAIASAFLARSGDDPPPAWRLHAQARQRLPRACRRWQTAARRQQPQTGSFHLTSSVNVSPTTIEIPPAIAGQVYASSGRRPRSCNREIGEQP